MGRNRKYTVDPGQLDTTCTLCQYPIPPSELLRIDGDQVRCPRCGGAFAPESKGNWSQLHPPKG